MKKTLVWVAIALMTAGCSSNGNENDTVKPEPVICPTVEPLTRSEQDLVSNNNDFAFNLMRQVADGKSKVLSPLSITLVLGMLNNGATGQTQEQINRVLGFTDADVVNSFCQKMLGRTVALDPKTKVLVANNIYVNKNYELSPVFVQKALDYYYAQPQTLDFADGKTLGIINQWCSDNTEGLIDQVLSGDEFDPSSVSYLLNAIYFKGTWTEQFDKLATRELPFDGGRKMPMMHQENMFYYAENDLFQALRMGYGSGKYMMTVLLPQEGKTIADVLANLNDDSWKSIFISDMPSNGYIVDVLLPRFETKADVDLIDIMSQLGMSRAFTSEAEFPNFCVTPTYIGSMKQVARIKVDEQGSEAAAVTETGLVDASAAPADLPVRVSFHAQRPFLYAISDMNTGAIYFIGQYTGQ